MRHKTSYSEKINKSVDDFFAYADDNVVYATPGTLNHSANFYGYDTICALDRDDVFNAILCAMDSWHFSDESGDELTGIDLVDAAIDAILDDLQYHMPEEN